MILPVFAFGQPVLKKKAIEISNEYDGLENLLEDMWETMYNAQGVGLAAPQIGKSIRLFIVDSTQINEEGDTSSGIKKVFINPTMLNEFGEECSYEEGCLSIPNIRAEVERLDKIKIKYLDENFVEHIDEFNNFDARVIQHEYDHIEGILFTDLLKPLKKRLLKRKLDNIKAGKVEADYRMKFVK
jgi:peptide deformylase